MTVLGGVVPAEADDESAAPGYPGQAADWSPGDKDGFGTAIGALDSKVWYTLNDGTLSEVFAPRIDTESSRDTQLVVTDGQTFTDREDQATDHRVELVDPRALVYRQVNTATSGRYRITKTYTTDPARSAVLVDVQFESLDGNPYQVYVLHDAALGLNANDDTGRSASGGLVATDGVQSSAVLASSGFTTTSSGYLGRSDGYSDLSSDHVLDDVYAAATDRGNVVQIGRTTLTGVGDAQHLTLALGFGQTEDDAAHTADAALDRGFDAALDAYEQGWHGYLDGLAPVPASADKWRSEYDVSAMVITASEDKTFRGGFVASPGRPWAWANELQQFPVYHEVWSRDLYQLTTALMAMGDTAAAERALDHLWTVQQRPDGSFPQNARLDGEAVFGGLQLDEVAFPIVLAWRLGRTGPEDWAHVKLSADFLVATGPRTEQERWENLAGYSPATIAAEIAGLVTAADLARANGDAVSAAYLATADQWQHDLGHYTVTSNGPLSPQPYYLRITDNGDANTGAQIQISDGGPLVDQREVLDPSFLDTVRLGVVDAADPAVLNTLSLIDGQLGYDTANGQFWHRSSFDGYGEKADGTQWQPVDPGSGLTIGRGWPLLTGERGEYELAAGMDAQERLDTMARSADDSSLFLPEQVWDDKPPSAEGSAFVPGEPTFSATPLAWSHAVFIRLAHAIDAGRPIDTPNVVACRYGTSLCRQ